MSAYLSYLRLVSRNLFASLTPNSLSTFISTSKLKAMAHNAVSNQKLHAVSFIAIFLTSRNEERKRRSTSYLLHRESPSLGKSPDLELDAQTARSNNISHADWLSEHQSAEEQYRYVESQNFGHSQDPELLWRFARACYCIYAYSTSITKEAKAAVIKDGLKAVEKAVELDPNNANAFLCLGKLTGCAAELYGYALPITSFKWALQSREYFKRATELDPDNHNAWFSLGVWSYNLLSRPIHERVAFFHLGGVKPDIHEGIKMLKKSNDLRSQPLTCLYIGKCYMYVNEKDEAKKWLETSVACTSSQTKSGAEYVCSKRDAAQLLKKL